MPLHRKSGAPVLEATTISSRAADARSEVRLRGAAEWWRDLLHLFKDLGIMMHYCGWLRDFTGFQPSFCWFIGFCSHPPYDNTENWGFRWFLLIILPLAAPPRLGNLFWHMLYCSLNGPRVSRGPWLPYVSAIPAAGADGHTSYKQVEYQPAFFHGHALTVAPMFCSFCCWSKLKNFRWIDYTLMWGNLHPISILPTWFNEGMAAMALQNRKIHMVTVIGIALKGKPWKDLRFHTVQQAEVPSEICWFRNFRCHDCLCVDWECFTFNIYNVL